MKNRVKTFINPIHLALLNHGFDFKKLMSSRFYLKFRKDRAEWLRQGGQIAKNHIILDDYTDSAGVAKGDYFHQDLLVAAQIHKHRPNRHIDIASRIDGFVAHVAAFREIEVVDVRPLKASEHENIKFRQANLMAPQELGTTDSLSCLHAVEHFGLGRYTDPIDVNGHNKGIANMINLISVGGRLYISFPVGPKDEVHFNAHRIFHPETILKHPHIDECMNLIRFDYVDHEGNLHLNVGLSDVVAEAQYGCGIYTFEKIRDIS